MNLFRPASLAVLLTLTLAGCKPSPAPTSPDGSDHAESPKPASAAPVPTSETGSASGTVTFAGKPPAPVLIDTSMDPACSFSGAKVFSEQFAVTHGKLANVFVYVKSGLPAAIHAAPISTQPVVLDQKGCQYTPHVLALGQGGSVEFRNSDPTMHNIHTMPTTAGDQEIDVSQGPKGPPVIKQFGKPETMMPVRCNNHPWMNAFLNVSATPFFAVSDAAGHFDLRGLPAGDYTLGAVHEKLGEQTLAITIKPQIVAHADFGFTSK